MDKEKEYRAAKGLNYSLLADFADAPDVALAPRKEKAYFETGHAFEKMVEDAATGSSLFAESFFVGAFSGDIPDDVILAIKKGEDLESLYTYTQVGKLNNTYKRKHSIIDECLFPENKGRMPISASLHADLIRMRDNLLDSEVDIFLGTAPKLSMRDLLQKATFQYPVYWEKDGIEKKALVDALTVIEYQGKDYHLLIDLKSSNKLSKFRGDYFRRYRIQDVHYTEGMRHASSLPVYPAMLFAVAPKGEMFLAQSFLATEETRQSNLKYYSDLVKAFLEWDAQGRPAKGWKELAWL